MSFTSNKGVNEPPPKPVAELESGFLRSAVSWAVLGIPAETPKSTVALPWKVDVMPTSYAKVAPRVNIFGMEIPASGIGKENSSFSY